MKCHQCQLRDVEPGRTVCSQCQGTRESAANADQPTLPPPTFAPAVGEVVRDTWRLVSRVGAGGMGMVFLAEELSLQRTVAIKFLADHLCQLDVEVKRFRREAQLAASVEHPHIVPIHAVGEQGGRPYLVMKHLSGPSLAELSTEQGPMPLPTVVPMLAKLAEGIDTLHARGVLHRDLKPANVVITHGQHPWLVDFGVSKALNAEPLTKANGVSGTAGFFAPEVMSAGGQASTPFADQYSFAVMAYQLLTGTLPFVALNDLGEWTLKHQRTFERPSRRLPGLPRGIDGAFERAFSPLPEQRFVSVSAFVEALGEADMPVASQPGAALRSLVAPPPRWRLALWLTLAAGLTAGAVAAAWSLLAQHEPPAPATVAEPPVVVVAPAPAAAVPPAPIALQAEPAEPAVAVLELPELELNRLTRRPKASVPVTPPAAVGTPPVKVADATGEVRVVTVAGGQSTWAQIAIDGNVVGNSPLSVSLSAGTHRVTASHPGLGTGAKTISVAGGPNPVVEIPLSSP